MTVGLLAIGFAGLGYAESPLPVPVQEKTAPAQKKAAPAEKKDAGEAKVQLKDLPPAVKATVETETKNATLKGLSKERENGKTVYELETVVNGRTRDLMIDGSGKVYDVEEQLDLEQAPAPVKAAIAAQGKLLALEKATTNGTTHYEGRVQTKAGKRVSFDLDADGKPVKR
jgi:uncharacterized membrane protein YkoI